MILKLVRKVGRLVQEFLERYVLGGFIQECIWGSKHLYRKSWTKISLGSKDLPHRDQLISSITSFDNVQSVLEIGCAAGPNLRRLREKLPSAQLVGIDINKQAIRTANNYFSSVNDDKVKLLARRADQLADLPDNNFNVVFSQAVLVCIPPSSINQVIADMIRLSSDGIVLNEYHLEGADKGFFDSGRWVYDYYEIIRRQCSEVNINMQKSDFKGGSWDLYGSLITVRH